MDKAKGAIMAGFDFGEGLRKIVLAGIGAVATGAEMGTQIVDELVKKGELTVEQGKALNEELSRKAAKAASDTQDTILRARLECMTPEERAAYADKIRDFAAEIAEREAAQTVDSVVEEAEDAAAEDAEVEDAEVEE